MIDIYVELFNLIFDSGILTWYCKDGRTFFQRGNFILESKWITLRSICYSWIIAGLCYFVNAWWDIMPNSRDRNKRKKESSSGSESYDSNQLKTDNTNVSVSDILSQTNTILYEPNDSSVL